MGLGAGVKSIQQGTGTVAVSSGTITAEAITITAVTLAKARVRAWVVNPATWLYTYSTQSLNSEIAPVLTAVDELTLYIHGPTATVRYAWEITELY